MLCYSACVGPGWSLASPRENASCHGREIDGMWIVGVAVRLPGAVEIPGKTGRPLSKFCHVRGVGPCWLCIVACFATFCKALSCSWKNMGCIFLANGQTNFAANPGAGFDSDTTSTSTLEPSSLHATVTRSSPHKRCPFIVA